MAKNHIYLLTLGHATNDMCQGALPALLPFFIKAYSLSYESAATLIFASTIFSSILQPIFGYFSDKISKSALISLGLMLSGLGICTMGFVSSYGALLSAAIVSGIGSALFHPEAAKTANAISSADKKAKGISIFAVGGNIGFAVGPLIAGFCAYHTGLHGLLVFGVITTLVALAFLLAMPAIKNLAKDVANSEPKGQNLAKNDWRSFSKLTAVIFSRSVIFFTLNTFIPIYWVHVLHQSESSASMALTILFSFGVVVTLVGGALSDKFGHIKTLRYAYIAMVPILFAFTQSTDATLCTILLFFVGIAIFVPYSPTVLLGQRYLAKNIGFASGVTLGLGVSVGGIITPAVGMIADKFGLYAAMQILWMTAVIGLVFSFMLTPSSQRPQTHA